MRKTSAPVYDQHVLDQRRGDGRHSYGDSGSLPVATALPLDGPARAASVASVGQVDLSSFATAPQLSGDDLDYATYESIIERAELDAEGAREYLRELGWSAPMQSCFVDLVARTPLRFMIFDDSGSMSTTDGHLQVGERSVSCSRWVEQRETVQFHAGLARAARAPTEMRFLNDATPLLLGAGLADEQAAVARLNGILERGPSGGTPLCKHIRDVAQQLRKVERQLRSAGQSAVLMVCTDGESSDGDMGAALKSLEQLPVLVVVRLCTDDERIAQYWNSMDANLELRLDVLDDLASEAAEVKACNPWLRYCVELHRMREFGLSLREFDLLDEALLNADEARTLLGALLGGARDDFPHPHDWQGFVQQVERRLEGAPLVWCPLRRRRLKIVSTSALYWSYGPKMCCVS